MPGALYKCGPKDVHTRGDTHAPMNARMHIYTPSQALTSHSKDVLLRPGLIRTDGRKAEVRRG